MLEGEIVRGQLFLVLCCCLFNSFGSPYFKKFFYSGTGTHWNHRSIGYRIMNNTAALLQEFVEVNRNVISMDSIKVFTGTIPPYIISRKLEEDLHQKFYDSCRHRDRNQLPESFRKVIEASGDIGILALTSLAIFSPDEKMRLTARIFGMGALSALFVKDLIKTVSKSKGNIRPYCQRYEKRKTFGGFPSGHMIEASYMATVWGLQYGWKVGVPLSIFATLMFATLVNSNRHFASQVVAGAGFGIAYGIAAHRLIEKKWGKRCQMQLCGITSPSLILSCLF